MELKDIYQLWDRMEASSVNELKLEMHGVRLVLKKACETKGMPVLSAPEHPEIVKQTTEETKEVIPSSSEAKIQVKAPLVGTFYQAPAPGEAPFVIVGQQVRKGDVVGIIEAMKLMNEIAAPKDGTVTAILVEDGDMVEYNQVLIEIK